MPVKVSDLIVDVGMNNGDDTAYYLHRGFRVLAIEAHPGLATIGKERFKAAIESRRVTILNVAIAENDGDLPFWVCDSNPEWSSFSRSIASRQGAAHHQITVHGRRFGDILEEYGVPHYVKIDIEGADMSCIRALTRETVPDFLSIELSDAVRSNLSRFRELGFTRFKCVSQLHYLPLQLVPSPQERTYGAYCQRLTNPRMHWRIYRWLGGRKSLIAKLAPLRTKDGWVFPPGSSGCFGEDTAGDWMSLEELTRTLEHFQAQFRRGTTSPFWGRAMHSFWADLHMSTAAVDPRRTS